MLKWLIELFERPSVSQYLASLSPFDALEVGAFLRVHGSFDVTLAAIGYAQAFGYGSLNHAYVEMRKHYPGLSNTELFKTFGTLVTGDAL